MSAHLQLLPVDVALSIIKFLYLPDIRALRLVSRVFDDLITDNEGTVYHHAALLHQYAPSIHEKLSDVVEGRPGLCLDETASWKLLCQQWFQLDKNWTGSGRVKTTIFFKQNRDVSNILSDEKHGLLITVHAGNASRAYQNSCLRVTDIKTEEELWTLPSPHVSNISYVYYSHGFLIIGRFGDRLLWEVWRLKSELTPQNTSVDSPPDEAQFLAFRYAEERHRSTKRGHFAPWALLSVPEPTSIHRFLYPTFTAASSLKAYFYDVSSGRRVQVFPDLQQFHGVSPQLGPLRSVDTSTRYLLVCGHLALRIFDRETGAMILGLGSYMTEYSKVSVTTQLDRSGKTKESFIMPLQLPVSISSAASRHATSWPAFIDARFSGTNPDLLILLSDNRLLLLQNFMRVACGQVSLQDAVLQIKIDVKVLPVPRYGHCPVSLGVEDNRICIVSVCQFSSYLLGSFCDL
ncbi:uncharacterized protein FIBRA_06970 [Fibroporia radiculosa]|uniref:F-box domain-containing protein n=1 Tax=Fibroporia radiculosa TaxID=599839 RepID=J4H4D0_9APHY|nr:uncharacterized protein FIBRA_06970 [Fibroporia radiculosa]CCM04779.1 predicted protein [Fibroporia radiculosa]